MKQTYEQWFDIAEKYTCGDMVWDILMDWRDERAKLKEEIDKWRAEYVNTGLKLISCELEVKELKKKVTEGKNG